MNDDERLLLAANQTFYEAFANSDFEGMDDLWAREYPVTCIHPGWSGLIGREPVMASWRAILSSGETTIESSSARACVLGDTAYVVCFEGARGEPPILVATNIFAREGGRWKLVHHHAGRLARFPAPEPARPLN